MGEDEEDRKNSHGFHMDPPPTHHLLDMIHYVQVCAPSGLKALECLATNDSPSTGQEAQIEKP